MATKKQKAAKRDKIEKETGSKTKKTVEEVKQPDNIIRTYAVVCFAGNF